LIDFHTISIDLYMALLRAAQRVLCVVPRLITFVGILVAISDEHLAGTAALGGGDDAFLLQP
jgi:hypothetical protein